MIRLGKSVGRRMDRWGERKGTGSWMLGLSFGVGEWWSGRLVVNLWDCVGKEGDWFAGCYFCWYVNPLSGLALEGEGRLAVLRASVSTADTYVHSATPRHRKGRRKCMCRKHILKLRRIQQLQNSLS